MNPRRAAAGIWLLSFAVCADRGSSEEACSLVPLERRLRIPGGAAFLGTINADTVLARAGAKRYEIAPGHYGRGTPRAVYGQIAVVRRLEQAAPQVVREAIVRDSSVVLVPWDYSASCDRVPWTRSAQWLPPGTSGVFVGTLRAREHWVGDRPTLDVIPEVAVYPTPLPRPRRALPMDGEMMSAEEFLALYEVLPDGRMLRSAPDSAAAPVLRWAQAFPELAGKQPAAYFLRYLRDQVVEERYRTAASPLAGTYRIVFRTATRDSSVIFARTELRPSSVIWSSSSTPEGRRPIGQYLLAVAAPSVAELPSRRAGPSPLEGYFALVDSSVARDTNGTVLLGSIDLEREAARLATDSLVRRRLEEAGRQKFAFQSELYRQNRPLTPGRFVLTPAGDVTFEMVIERDGAPLLTVRAERISREHLEPRSP